jgi:photosystem II stability/assembly factor-like uncharacterized protein
LLGVTGKSGISSVAVGEAGTVLRRANGVFALPSYSTGLTLRTCSNYVDTVWSAGDSGLIFRSINNGSSWVNQSYSSVSKANFYASAVRTKDAVWVAGDSGIILYSTNGGTSFTKQSNTSHARVRDIAWAKQTAYACGDSGTLIRGNFYGIQGWAKFSTTKRFPFRGIAMDTFNVFVVGDSGYVLRHDFLNQTTISDTVLDANITFYDVAFYPPYVVIGGSNGTIKVSNDSGVTWTTPQTHSTENIYHIAMADDFPTSGVVYAVGEDGLYLKSTNFGSSWIRLDSGKRATIYAAAKSPNSTMYATSASGIVFRSSDGGSIWSRDSINVAGARFTDISFDDNGFGLMATYDNKVFRTLDSGATWTSQTIASSGVLILGVATSGNIGLACAPNGAIYRTTNKGTSWSSVTSNTNKTLYDIDMKGSNAIAVGESGGMVYSTNGGQTWTSSTSGSLARLQKVRFAGNGGVAVAVAQAGAIIRTTNNGQTWSNSTSSVTGNLNDVSFRDAANGIVCGDGGILLKTTNGGASWKIDTSHTFNDLKGSIILDADNAFVFGNKTTILSTANSGLPVELVSFSAHRTRDQVVVLNWSVALETNNAYYLLEREIGNKWEEIGKVNSYGTSTNCSYTFMDADAPLSSATYRLKQYDLDGMMEVIGKVTIGAMSRQAKNDLLVWPNPASRNTVVTYILNQTSDIKLYLLAMTGGKIRTLAEGEFVPGSYSENLSLEGLASGMYQLVFESPGERVIRSLAVTH